MPAAGFGGRYLHNDLYEMAAAYLFHITQNHPLIDGNKRTGIVVAIVFLFLNGVEFNADETELERIVLGVAEGNVGKDAVAEFFRHNCRT
jgi:death-on-curing protein